MNRLTKFKAFIQDLSILETLLMLKNSEKVYYAVGRGKKTGIYESWKECKAQTEGVANAKFRKFYNLIEAEEFVDFWRNYSSPVKESAEIKNLVEHEKNFDKVNEIGRDCEVQPTSLLESTCHHLSSPEMPCTLLQPSSSHVTSSEVQSNQKNIDILALNLRIDSFEKRFDAILKELGAISSEISHLKSDIKELKEFSSSSCPHSGCSPKKDKNGLLQTTLNFGSNVQNASSMWSQFDRQQNTDSKISKPSALKRKLSSSDLFGSSKRFADDSRNIDDLLSKIKMETIDYTSFTVDEDDYVEVYTDGAAHGNGFKNARAGIGIWFGEKHPMNVAEAVVGNPTNNVAEIQAARVAIELAIKAGITKLKIFTDSEFLINCATKWINRWKRNGWILSKGGPVKNRKDLEKLDMAASKINVRWEKVPGHAGIKGNETADKLANEGALKYNE